MEIYLRKTHIYGNKMEKYEYKCNKSFVLLKKKSKRDPLELHTDYLSYEKDI